MAGARLICVSDRFDDSGLFGAMIPDEFLGKRVEGNITMDPFSNIGTNAVVLPGSHLRTGVLLTVGSVLYGDTEPWTVYEGNPASPKRKIDPAKSLAYAKELGYEFD
jgi:acetyltransferase-like isoleucine patch superfamily enzyme